jgi:NAD+ synthase (glutamine-hydrolysing)
MRLIKVAAAVLNTTPLAWDANRTAILEAIREARRLRVGILCLPELCLTGYGCEDAFLSNGTQAMAQKLLLELVPETTGMAVSFGLPMLHRGALFNTAALAVDGTLLGFVAKQHLAGEGIHYEPRWFKRWPNNAREQVELAGRAYPFGDLLFDVGDVRIGFEICEDAWVANRPGGELAERGVDIILNPSASHFAFGKFAVRQRFVLEGSRAFSVGYVYSNLVGNESGRAIYDGGALIAQAGRLLAAGPRFSYADSAVTTATLDIDEIRMGRARTGSFRPLLGDPHDNAVRVPFQFPKAEYVVDQPRHEAWELGSLVKEEEFTRAVSLGLFDYLRKSHSRGFVVSISGGADSAAVSLLCAMLVQFGVAELGRDRFLAKLAYMPQLAAAADNRELVRRLLTCVYQSTANSTETTRDAARTVADGIGADFHEFDVDQLVRQYIAMVSQALGRELTWERDDLALQNIQARVRSPGVWMMANTRQALLLATSNRSEAAVGYATMDGDTSGGLSPVTGIDKAFLRHWLRWMESTGPAGDRPHPELNPVNVQPPTAELRPHAAHQTDEDDLMPYDVLDSIERSSIRDKRTPLECLWHLRQMFPQHALPQLAIWVRRFFTLWCRNQWKRERFAPSFHLDDENLDPKTWCRFPILSGGYERELDELDAWVNEETTGGK